MRFPRAGVKLPPHRGPMAPFRAALLNQLLTPPETPRDRLRATAPCPRHHAPCPSQFTASRARITVCLLVPRSRAIAATASPFASRSLTSPVCTSVRLWGLPSVLP